MRLRNLRDRRRPLMTDPDGQRMDDVLAVDLSKVPANYHPGFSESSIDGHQR